MKLRNVKIVEGWRQVNDGTRTLIESILANEVEAALRDWINNIDEHTRTNSAVIGGIAISFYGKPRMTSDIDVLFISPAEIPDKVTGFKRTRPGAFQHNKTHVEIEVVHPKSINTSEALIQKVIDIATLSNNIRVASKSGIVALKLGRGKFQDKADIVTLIQSGGVNIKEFPLGEKEIILYNELLDYANKE